MKGLMLTLMLTWTGMVMAQQDDNSNGFKTASGTSAGGFRVEGERAPEMVPIVGPKNPKFGATVDDYGATQNDRARSAFATRQRPSEMLVPRETPFSNRSVRSSSSADATPTMFQKLDPMAISLLVDEGVISKAVDVSTSQNTELIRFSDQGQATTASIATIQGRLNQGALVFELDTSQLRDIDRKALEFDVPENIRGRYDQIVIQYPPTLSKVAAQNQTAVRNSEPAGINPRWKIAGERDSNADRDSRSNRNLQIQRREDDRYAMVPKRNFETAALLGENEKRTREQYDRNAAERERQRLLEENRQLRADKMDLLSAAQKSQMSDAEYEYRLRQRQLANDRLSQVVPRQTAPPAQPTADPNYSALLNELNALRDRNRDTELRLAKMEGQNDLLAGKLKAVSYENTDSMSQRRDRFNDSAHQNRIVDRRPSLDKTVPISDSLRRSREQTQLNIAGGFDIDDDLAAGAGNLRSAGTKKQNGPTELMLFILLLMSVALNLYLWWLSRTFHSRYQELADELRETFTATV